jgi:tetratricopeptide (TPR) repeat protein
MRTPLQTRLVLLLFVLIILPGNPLAGQDKKTREMIEMYTKEGMELYGEKYYLGAVEKWNEVLKLEPWNEDLKILVARALEQYTDLTRRVEDAYRLLQEGKNDQALEAFEAVKEESSPKSRDLYTLLVKGIRTVEERRNRERYQSIIARGDRYMEKGDYEQARNQYLYAPRFYPEGTLHGERLAKLESLVAEEKFREMVEGRREEAIALFGAGKYAESRDAWEKLLALAPGDEEALLYLSKIAHLEQERDRLLERARAYYDNGLRLMEEKRYEEAIDQLQNALALGYHVDEVAEIIARIRDRIADRDREERARLAELVAGYLREGIKLYNLNRYRDSLAELNKGLKIDPANSQIREYILRDTIALRREEERSVGPASPFYKLIEDLIRLGTDAYDQGRFDDAVKRWEEILLIFPFNEIARENLTRSIAKVDPALAKEILEGLYREAQDLIDRDRKREAEVKLKLILEVDRNFRDAARILQGLQRAVEEEEKPVVTDEDRRKAEALYVQGLDLYRQEELKEAIRLWHEAVRLNPEYVEARVSLSRAETQLSALSRVGTVQAGLAASLSEEDRIRLKRHYLNGINFFLDGFYREAIDEWEEVVKIDPQYENVQVNIKRARQRLEMTDEGGST